MFVSHDFHSRVGDLLPSTHVPIIITCTYKIKLLSQKLPSFPPPISEKLSQSLALSVGLKSHSSSITTSSSLISANTRPFSSRDDLQPSIQIHQTLDFRS